MAGKKYLYIHENIFVQIANGMSVKFTDGLYVYIMMTSKFTAKKSI